MTQVNHIGRTAPKVTTNERGETVVKYHDTIVVAFNHDCIVLNHGGWQTVTTKRRMNQTSRQFDLGYNVFQVVFEWFVSYRGQTIPFDGSQLILKR